MNPLVAQCLNKTIFHVEFDDQRRVSNSSMLEFAASLATNTVLTTLSMSGGFYFFPDELLAFINAFRVNVTLARIYIAIPFDSRMVEVLAYMLTTNTTLKELSICVLEPTDRAVAALVEALTKWNTTLTSLYFRSNRILSTEAARSIAALFSRNTSVTSIELDFRDVELAGAPILAAALASSTTLDRLSFGARYATTTSNFTTATNFTLIASVLEQNTSLVYPILSIGNRPQFYQRNLTNRLRRTVAMLCTSQHFARRCGCKEIFRRLLTGVIEQLYIRIGQRGAITTGFSPGPYMHVNYLMRVAHACARWWHI